MKKIVLLFMACLIILSTTGCQYLTPPIIKAGSTEIAKDTEEKIPAKTVAPNTFEIEVTPPKPTTNPGFSEYTRWYMPIGK